eukprot:6000509-Amphidinium_carterae.1
MPQHVKKWIAGQASSSNLRRRCVVRNSYASCDISNPHRSVNCSDKHVLSLFKSKLHLVPL